MAALDAAVLELPRAAPFWRAVAVAACAAAILVLGFGVRARVTSSIDDTGPLVEVDAQPSTRWVEHRGRDFDRVELLAGVALFTVHRHGAQKVTIQLPDGEVEDFGTVFEIRVSEQRTRRISVKEGRIWIRLHERAPFAMAAGESWEAASVPPDAQASAAGALAPRLDPARAGASSPPPTSAAVAASGSVSIVRRQPARPAREPGTETAPAASSGSASRIETPAPDALAAKQEDDAYLRIIDLAERAKYSQARAEAKRYLLRFPSGFRRVEVLNVATRGAEIFPPSR